jgi:plasmid replication initiation protein
MVDSNMPSSTVTNSKPSRRTIPGPRGRDEMNLVEFPFATLSHKTTLGSIKCVRWIAGADGQRRKQSWIVQGGSASGLPTEFDERVYVALMALTHEQGFASRKVPLSVYRLLTLMGESTDGAHYRSIERSLERLLRASIVAEGAFWDAERGELVHQASGFHLLERYWLAYQEDDAAASEREGVPGYIVWGEEVWRSLRSGYLKQLDLETFYQLRTPIARRLYRFLDKKLHRNRRLEIDIFQLSQQLGMAYYRYPAKVKEKLQPGIDELMAIGFLARAEIIKVKRYTRMRFLKGAGVPSRGTASEEADDGQEQLALDASEALRLARDWRQRTAQARDVEEGLVELWEQTQGLLHEQVSPGVYQTWLARTLLIDVQGTVATLLVPSAFVQQRINQRYTAPIQQALKALLHTTITLEYVLMDE